jgi:hypothetical protein
METASPTATTTPNSLLCVLWLGAHIIMLQQTGGLLGGFFLIFQTKSSEHLFRSFLNKVQQKTSSEIFQKQFFLIQENVQKNWWLK